MTFGTQIDTVKIKFEFVDEQNYTYRTCKVDFSENSTKIIIFMLGLLRTASYGENLIIYFVIS